jgi:MFS family permease
MIDVRPLGHRSYRLLFIAQSVSLFGTMITYAALPYHVYRLTGSSFSVGLLGLVELLPLLVTAFVGGALADAYDRRRLGAAADVALAAGASILALLAAHRGSTLMLYLIAAWMSGVGALQRPALESLVPQIIPKDAIPAAASLAMIRGSIAMIVAPAVGGMLIAAVGLPATYLVDFGTYVFSLICLLAMAPVGPVEAAEAASIAAVREGFRYAASRQELLGTYLVDFVAMVFGMPLALFPALSDRFGGASAVGLLYAAPAAGALAASVTSRWTHRVTRHGRGVILSASVWGIAIVAFGLCSRLWPALACLVVAGAADAVSGVFRTTLWNTTIPDALRGRLASIEMVSYSSGPLLGNFEAGAAAAAFGVSASVVSGGALCVAGVVCCALALPRFAAYDAARAGEAVSLET